MSIRAPKGTSDILPGSVEAWQYIEGIYRETAALFGFDEIRIPTFEYTELFARGIGDSTDVVEKQMYTFQDFGGRSLTLRPEGTAGVVRAYLEKKLYAGVIPSKYWYDLSCFRYENTQAGRYREFHQFGAEVIASHDMLADMEVIWLADTFLRKVGVNQLSLRINSIGCPKCRPVYREALRAFLAPKYDQLCDTCKGRYDKNPLRILDCKSPIDQELVKGAPLMIDYLCDECKDDLAALEANLKDVGVAYEIDPMIVRGLDYYTKTAFEFVSERIGAQGTVCGGGRYDHLMLEIGGEDIPGVGYGLGKERLLLEIAASGGYLPGMRERTAQLIFVDASQKKPALEVLSELREAGIEADIDTSARSMKAQFKHADRTGARFCVVIGGDEVATDTVTLKDMVSGEQRRIGRKAAAAEIKGCLSES
jgi:histidyl-tRNA synthetase